MRWDTQNLGSLLAQPVWSGATPPDSVQGKHDAFLKVIGHSEHLKFWRRFYEGMWNGTFDEWALAFEVIQIPEEDWEKGYEHIGEVISGIEARLLAERAPLAERIVFDEDSEIFTVEPIPLENAPLIQTITQRIEDCLDDALNGCNGLRPDESVVTKLRRANSRYSNNPQRLEMDYTAAAASLRRLSDSGEIAETEDNLDLREAVEDGVRALRANHPDIAANRHQLAKLRMAEMDSDAVDLLEDAKPVLEALSSGALQEDFADDIPQLINDATLPLPTGAPPLPGADEATRIFSRVSRMKLIYDDLTEKGATVFDSKGFKTARLGLTIGAMLSALVSLGLLIIGVV
ncbi:hypothetical protein PSJ8397_02182 [Pseudooctadecabacter jejudonensis]|uniref:Uncharacterized protein n=2 Tax=Pseudooctadecabacter jejudonensis TaxID=1391910 RepID=A0A1Y5SLD8_9RHOB|nr:hypothetical protein PSJ8397_02182 [Pseudooctadecabacter jejudonensis]